LFHLAQLELVFSKEMDRGEQRFMLTATSSFSFIRLGLFDAMHRGSEAAVRDGNRRSDLYSKGRHGLWRSPGYECAVHVNMLSSFFGDEKEHQC
jgi:hypothetical protein